MFSSTVSISENPTSQHHSLLHKPKRTDLDLDYTPLMYIHEIVEKRKTIRSNLVQF